MTLIDQLAYNPRHKLVVDLRPPDYGMGLRSVEVSIVAKLNVPRYIELLLYCYNRLPPD